MSEVQRVKAPNTPENGAAARKREVAQVTFSTISNVSVAASEMVNRVAEAPSRTRWKPILLVFSLLYASSVTGSWLLATAPLWERVALVPIFPVLCATAAFGWRQRWKFRAKDWQYRLKIWEDALDSVAHEAINSVNAIRAQLIGFRLANPQVNLPEHLDIIQEETRRIDAVVQKAQDPVTWKIKKKRAKQANPAQVGEETRSRIAL